MVKKLPGLDNGKDRRKGLGNNPTDKNPQKKKLQKQEESSKTEKTQDLKASQRTGVDKQSPHSAAQSDAFKGKTNNKQAAKGFSPQFAMSMDVFGDSTTNAKDEIDNTKETKNNTSGTKKVMSKKEHHDTKAPSEELITSSPKPVSKEFQDAYFILQRTKETREASALLEQLGKSDDAKINSDLVDKLVELMDEDFTKKYPKEASMINNMIFKKAQEAANTKQDTLYIQESRSAEEIAVQEFLMSAKSRMAQAELDTLAEAFAYDFDMESTGSSGADLEGLAREIDNVAIQEEQSKKRAIESDNQSRIKNATLWEKAIYKAKTSGTNYIKNIQSKTNSLKAKVQGDYDKRIKKFESKQNKLLLASAASGDPAKFKKAKEKALKALDEYKKNEWLTPQSKAGIEKKIKTIIKITEKDLKLSGFSKQVKAEMKKKPLESFKILDKELADFKKENSTIDTSKEAIRLKEEAKKLSQAALIKKYYLPAIKVISKVPGNAQEKIKNIILEIQTSYPKLDTNPIQKKFNDYLDKDFYKAKLFLAKHVKDLTKLNLIQRKGKIKSIIESSTWQYPGFRATNALKYLKDKLVNHDAQKAKELYSKFDNENIYNALKTGGVKPNIELTTDGRKAIEHLQKKGYSDKQIKNILTKFVYNNLKDLFKNQGNNELVRRIQTYINGQFEIINASKTPALAK